MDAGRPLILFDGFCKLCDGFVGFVSARDRSGLFLFVPLQSAAGRSTLAALGLEPDATETLVLVESGGYSVRSEAVLRVLRRLSWPWPALFALILVPRPIRDLAYRLLAANRRRWFGRRETCAIPPERDRGKPNP